MNKAIEERIYAESEYILRTKSTVREVAKVFKVSKSTVHKDLQDRLKDIDEKLHDKINKLFKEHVEIRHLKGGEATRQKFLKIKEG